jgi:hypothetical protein
MFKTIKLLCLMVAATFCAATPSFAQIVFQDNFNAENGGTGTTNYAGFANWTVSNGTVDLIGNGFFDLYPGNGLFLDLDGSSADAGILTSTPIALAVGTYQLDFALGIHGGFGSDAMTVSLGGAYSESFSGLDAGTITYNQISRQINIPTAGNYSLVFDHAGGDNFGLVIDNVQVNTVPEPASFILLGGFAAIYLLARRR